MGGRADSDAGRADHHPLLRRYVAATRERISPRTGRPITGVSVYGYANALRTFLNFCAREDWLDERVTRRYEMPRREKKVLQILTTEQIQRLFRVAETTTAPARDRAILAVLLDTGVRVSELGRLTLEDVHLTADGSWLKIQGKGRREREVPPDRKARQALFYYIHTVREAPRHVRYAILGKRGQLTQTGVDKLLYALRDKAGAQHFVGVQVSAHTFRRTFAVRFLDAGGLRLPAWAHRGVVSGVGVRVRGALLPGLARLHHLRAEAVTVRVAAVVRGAGAERQQLSRTGLLPASE